MKKITTTILTGISSFALTFAANSLSQASTLFTHQPVLDNDVKARLKNLRA